MNIPLSNTTKEIIFGSLLGDGSLRINKQYKNARFSFRHSIKQKDYFLWKVSQLQEISGEKYVWEQVDKDSFGKDKIRYQSKSLESLTQIYELTHKRGKFVIKRKWLNTFSPLSLMVWWLDDGSLVSYTRKGVFCTDGFSFQDILVLKKYLFKVWKIETKIAKTGKKEGQYRLWIYSREELVKFLRIILPYIPTRSMLYKVILLYKDPKLQQRWISEIESLTSFSRETIEKIVLERKEQSKNFRE